MQVNAIYIIMAVLPWRFIYTVSLNCMIIYATKHNSEGCISSCYSTPFLFFFFPFSVPFFLIQNASTESFAAVRKSWLIRPKISSLPFKIQFPTDSPSNKTIFLYSYVNFYHLRTLQIPWKTGIKQKKKKNKVCHFFVYSSHLLTSPPPAWKEQLHCLQSY